MTEEKKEFDITGQLRGLVSLQPISVGFLRKPRKVHFFHRDTAAAFLDALRGTSENDSMKRRRQREVRLLAIVLADLYGSSPHFRRLRRWFWRVRLEHTRYSDVEAVALLDASRERIHDGMQIDALNAILLVQIQAIVASMGVRREDLVEVLNEKKEDKA